MTGRTPLRFRQPCGTDRSPSLAQAVEERQGPARCSGRGGRFPELLGLRECCLKYTTTLRIDVSRCKKRRAPSKASQPSPRVSRGPHSQVPYLRTRSRSRDRASRRGVVSFFPEPTDLIPRPFKPTSPTTLPDGGGLGAGAGFEAFTRSSVAISHAPRWVADNALESIASHVAAPTAAFVPRPFRLVDTAHDRRRTR